MANLPENENNEPMSGAPEVKAPSQGLSQFFNQRELDAGTSVARKAVFDKMAGLLEGHPDRQAVGDELTLRFAAATAQLVYERTHNLIGKMIGREALESALRLRSEYESLPPTQRERFEMSEAQQEFIGEYGAWQQIIEAYTNNSKIFGLSMLTPNSFVIKGMASGTISDPSFLSRYNADTYTIKDDHIERYRTSVDLRDAPDAEDSRASEQYLNDVKFQAQIEAMEGRNAKPIDSLAMYGTYLRLDRTDQALEELELLPQRQLGETLVARYDEIEAQEGGHGPDQGDT